tara:strand:+ start:4522 stop:5361 length:840 start_codon:yes stop_codon:yes gene_type:complete
MQTPAHSLSSTDQTLRCLVLQTLPHLAGKTWQPLPGGRINQLWRVGDTVVKRYSPAGASPLFPNDQEAEAHALRHLHPAGFAPELLADAPGWIAYRYVHVHKTPAPPVQIAQVLARLHSLPVPDIAWRRLNSGNVALRAQGLGIARQCNGALPALPLTADLPPAKPCMIHGDAVPGNIIASRRGVTLIDWQCPALGDPCEDIAAWLSPAMQWLYTGRPLPAGDAAAFLGAFPAATIRRYRTLAPLFHWRMAAHCLWRAERGAADYREALALELAALPAA